MLVSIPVETIFDPLTGTNITDDTAYYDSGATYVDGTLAKYTNPDDNYPEAIYGIFNVEGEHRFVYYSPTAPSLPFDGKNYTKVKSNADITYTIHGDGLFDTVAFGRVIGSAITITFYDEFDAIIYSIPDFPIACSVCPMDRVSPSAITQILYSPYDVPAGGHVDITIHATEDANPNAEVGSIYLGTSLEAGFTHLAFTNRYRDFSPQEQDQWGNISYIEGVKVNLHNGTVELPVSNYDYMTRLMLRLGATVVLLNGNGTKSNAATDGESRFNSVMMIGRLKDFSLKTRIDKKRLGDTASYTFTVEEIV